MEWKKRVGLWAGLLIGLGLGPICFIEGLLEWSDRSKSFLSFCAGSLCFAVAGLMGKVRDLERKMETKRDLDT